MTTTTTPIVSPANSQEENRRLYWFSKIQEGLTVDDWHALAEEKSTIPLLDDLGEEKDQTVAIRCMGMVQDMLESGYCHMGEDSLVEQTPLVIVPIPQTTLWFRQIVYDSVTAHRDKRLCLDDDDVVTDQTTVVANFYYDQYANQPHLRLNELVEIVGVMERSMEDANAGVPSWDEQEVAMPRVQVLWYRKIDLDQSILLPPALPVQGLPSNDHIASALSKALAVDFITANAIWMTLLSLAEREPSGVPRRTPQETTTLGCASLNIVLPDANACQTFQKRLDRVLSSIVPLLVKPVLSKLPLPKKENGRLLLSPLQLPKGATVILNASEIRPGPISNQVLTALQTAQELTSGHRVPYHFDGGVTIPFEADVRVIVLCTPETKSILPCMLQVKCNWSHGEALDSRTCHSVREHLANARLGKSIDLPLELLNEAQSDFLQRRHEARQHNWTVDEMSFHRWLTLTRLIARGRRAEKAATCDWNAALQLDDAMLASLS